MSRVPRSQESTPRLVRLICAAAGMIVFLCAAYYVGSMLEKNTQQPEIRGDLTTRFSEKNTVTYEGKSYALRKDISTILLMGVDKEADAKTVGYRNGGQADFLVLLILDNTNKVVTPLQIDRDTMTEITILGVLGNAAGTRNAQICLSHGFGDGKEQSCSFTADAVSKLLLGVPMNDYISMDLDGISALNDAVGGVTVTIADDFSHLDGAMTPGTTLTLSGQQAEYFVRGRMSIGVGTNEARMKRQRVYIDALSELLNQKVSNNSDFVGRLFDSLSPYLVTNMSRARIVNEAWSTRSYAREATSFLEGEHKLNDDGFMAFYADETALEQLVIKLFYAPVES